MLEMTTGQLQRCIAVSASECVYASNINCYNADIQLNTLSQNRNSFYRIGLQRAAGTSVTAGLTASTQHQTVFIKQARWLSLAQTCQEPTALDKLSTHYV